VAETHLAYARSSLSWRSPPTGPLPFISCAKRGGPPDATYCLREVCSLFWLPHTVPNREPRNELFYHTMPCLKRECLSWWFPEKSPRHLVAYTTMCRGMCYLEEPTSSFLAIREILAWTTGPPPFPMIGLCVWLHYTMHQRTT